MIGYITPYKPDLKYRDYCRYQEYYCGLCRALGQRYHLGGRISLGYDMTFLAVLLDSVYDSQTERETFRCVLHPFQKRNRRKNRWLDYAADMNLYMTWFKCLDDWRDDRNLIRGLYALILSRRAGRIEKRYPEKTAVLRKTMQELQELEQKKSCDFEEVSGCFGRTTAEMFRFGGIWEDALSRTGYYLGKYIYLLDAYEDLEDDLKKDRYNPFREHCRKDGFPEMVSELLLLMVSRASEEFEMLPAVENTELLRNILYAGVWQRFLEIRKKKTQACDASVMAEGTGDQ